MRKFGVGDALSSTHTQRLELPWGEHVLELARLESREPRPNLPIGGRRHDERAPMRLGDRQEPLEELLRVRAPANGKKIDQLNEKPGLAAARPPHRLDQ